MKLVIVSNRLIGEKLASPIYNENGVLFLGVGSEIKESAIKKLTNMNVTTLYIEDNNDEISLKEVLEAQLKLKLLKDLRAVYEEVKNREVINENKIDTIVKAIIENINLSENAVMINNLMPSDNLGKLVVHCLDVCLYSIMVGTSRKFDIKKLSKLAVAALLHDIGKLFDDSERHVRITYEAMKKSPSFSTLSYVAIHQLYETVNGKGPLGLEGDKISEFAKIIGICNEYSKLINTEDSMLPHEAIEKIGAESIDKFDKDIYKSFIESVYCYPTGLPIILNNGLYGVVVMQNKKSPTRPIIAVKYEGQYKFINLIEMLTLFVEKVDL